MSDRVCHSILNKILALALQGLQGQGQGQTHKAKAKALSHKAKAKAAPFRP